MKVDDKVLDEIAVLIKENCQKLNDVIKEYQLDIKNLEDYWDGSNFNDLLSEVKQLTDLTEKTVVGIDNRFNPYFRKKAEMIRNRPLFSGGVVYSSHSSNSTSTSSQKSGKTAIDKVFEHCNEEITKKIYTYLRKIKFYKPNERIYFYDPDGKSKRGLYKNIMAIDMNSPTFEQDMHSLTAQHIFFQIQHMQKMQLIRCLGIELENNAHIHDSEFIELTKTIQKGTGIETKYLSFQSDDIRLSFYFFVNAFKATASNNTAEIDKYKKYYSNSYGQFVEILQNLTNYK